MSTKSFVLPALFTVLLSACGAFEAETPSQGAAAGNIPVTGELQSSNSYYFGPPTVPDIWNYTIAFMAPDGQVVGEGATILRFDTQELMTKMRDKNNALNEKQKELEKTQIIARDQLAEMRLRVEEAGAALDKARLKADIPKVLLATREYRENQLLLEQAVLEFALRKEELIKEETIQSTEIEILQREVSVLEVESGQLAASIASMTIKAPGEGVVIHALDRHRNKLSVGDSVWMGRRVMEFPDLSQLEAQLEIPERDADRVRVGQKVRFSLEAAPDQQFFGQIIEVASVVRTRSVNQPDKVFDAKVVIENPDTKMMRPGMSISAEILAAMQQGGES